MNDNEEIVGFKTCTKCGETKEATVECFYTIKNAMDGLSHQCQGCFAAYAVHARAYQKGTPFPTDVAPVPNTFVCLGCSISLPYTLEHFRKDKSRTWGLSYKCCACCRDQEATRIRDRRNRMANTSHESFLKYKLGNAIRGAQERFKDGRVCDLTPEEAINLYVEQGPTCALSGVLMASNDNNSEVEGDKLSIDRVDSSLGYTKDNVQLTCTTPNIMKMEMTTQELTWWASRIVDHQGYIPANDNDAPNQQLTLPL